MSAEHVFDGGTLLLAREADEIPSLGRVAGFFYAIRVFFVLVGVRVFQQEADSGVAASILINYLLLFAAIIQAVGEAKLHWGRIFRQPGFIAVLAYFLLTGSSLLWSATASLPAAVAFWGAMFADAAIVLLLIRSHGASATMTAVAQGFVWGASCIAIIAWILPAQADLRLGDEELLGPNQIGWVCGFAFFLAQFLVRRKIPGAWNLHALLLGVTLLRSLSKTTLIAFLAAQSYILVSDRSITPKTKRRLALLTFAVVAIFSSLLSSYYDEYTTTGDQSENLTGRLGIWAYMVNEGLDRPWFGHGFHSVWKVVPPFYGTFEARHAHNEAVQQFYAYGVAGLLLLLFLYTVIFRMIRKLPPSSVRVLFAGFLLFVLVRGLADTEAFDLSWPMWFLVLVGAFVHEVRTQEALA